MPRRRYFLISLYCTGVWFHPRQAYWVTTHLYNCMQCFAKGSTCPCRKIITDIKMLNHHMINTCVWPKCLPVKLGFHPQVGLNRRNLKREEIIREWTTHFFLYLFIYLSLSFLSFFVVGSFYIHHNILKFGYHDSQCQFWGRWWWKSWSMQEAEMLYAKC